MTDSILVAFDDSGKGVLIVGKKRLNESAEIINAFEGDEAKELWKKLTVKKEKK